MDITVLDLSAYVGLTAVAAITINMLLGVLMAFRYSPSPQLAASPLQLFPPPQLDRLRRPGRHDSPSAPAASQQIPKFRVLDIVYPVHSPQQPLENTIGAIALYIVALMVVTSYFRIQLGRRTWKAFHFTVYLGAIALFWHSSSPTPT